VSIDKKFGIAVLVLVVLIALDLWAHHSQYPYFMWTLSLGPALLLVLGIWAERLWKCPKCGGRTWYHQHGADIFKDPGGPRGYAYCADCGHTRGEPLK
jgi:hypothetical protein